MSIEGIKFCDHCGGAIFLDDVAPVKMERDGHLQLFHFHNRHKTDCLAQEILQLETELAELAAA
jgi:hypothetical protein